MSRIQYFILAILLGAFLTQGFQCSSPEMTTARVAKSKNEFPRAIEMYQKELTKNSNNSEAMYELAEIYLKMAESTPDNPEKLFEALKLVVKAKQASQSATAKPTKNANKYASIEYNAWVSAFNFGVGGLDGMRIMQDDNSKKDMVNKMGEVISKIFENCIIINPDNPDNYSMLGMCYSYMSNTEKAVEYFEKYNNVMGKEIEFISAKGLSIGQNPENVIKILGKPAKYDVFTWFLNPKDPKAQDTSAIMIYKIDGTDLAIYTRHNTKTSKTGVTGWRFNPSEIYRQQPFEFNVTPTAELARIYFDKKNYDKAVTYVEQLKKIDPSNASANQFLVQILEAQGDGSKALITLEKLVKESPDNAAYRAQYGDILVRNKKYPEAIAQYEAALKIKPDLFEVKRILGSAYKNQAVEIQKAEFNKLDKDPAYKINEASYMPILEKSKTIFEELSRNIDYSANYIILLELADIYIATNSKDKLTTTLDRLVTLKDNVETADMEFYLLNMINYFDKTKNQEKLDLFNQYYKDMKK